MLCKKNFSPSLHTAMYSYLLSKGFILQLESNNPDCIEGWNVIFCSVGVTKRFCLKLLSLFKWCNSKLKECAAETFVNELLIQHCSKVSSKCHCNFTVLVIGHWFLSCCRLFSPLVLLHNRGGEMYKNILSGLLLRNDRSFPSHSSSSCFSLCFHFQTYLQGVWSQITAALCEDVQNGLIAS